MHWSDLNFEADVNAEILKSEKLTVTVMDENNNTSDVLIGKGFSRLLKFTDNFQKECDVVVTLSR